jgi:hypothetical protein
MSYYGIRPINRSCGSYGPGHQMHWIQAKKSWEDEQPMIDVSIVVHHDGRVDLEGYELTLTMWNHDPDRLCDVVDYAGVAVRYGSRDSTCWLCLGPPVTYSTWQRWTNERHAIPVRDRPRESPPRIFSSGQ